MPKQLYTTWGVPQLRGSWRKESLYKGRITWKHPSGAEVRVSALLQSDELSAALKKALDKFKKSPEWIEILKQQNRYRSSRDRAAKIEKKAKAKQVEEERGKAALWILQQSEKYRSEFAEKVKENRAAFEERRKRPEAKPDGHDFFEKLRRASGGTQHSLIGRRFPISGRSNETFP